MYEGYHNTQKAINNELKKEGGNISNLDIPIMREGTSLGWKFTPSSSGKSAVWQHVQLSNQKRDGVTVPVWVPIEGDTVEASGSWSKMKQATKQFRTRNN